MSAGNRGKWAEGEVRSVLADLEKGLLGFTFNRIPDAHGGFLQPAAADFQWFLKATYTLYPHELGVQFQPISGLPITRNGLIEVKEVEHLTRLGHGNFSADKIVRMYKRELAGSETIVLVAHKLKGMRKPDVTWRAVPLSLFRNTEYVKGVGSWDLSSFPLVNMTEYVLGMFK